MLHTRYTTIVRIGLDVNQWVVCRAALRTKFAHFEPGRRGAAAAHLGAAIIGHH